jgi:coproporphyrinogen III oxidase
VEVLKETYCQLFEWDLLYTRGTYFGNNTSSKHKPLLSIHSSVRFRRASSELQSDCNQIIPIQ